MAIGILGRKVGMTQIFEPSGEVVPVTVIEAGPCHVLQIRTADRDGYEAVQLGFLDKRRPKHSGRNQPRHAASRSERGSAGWKCWSSTGSVSPTSRDS